MVRWAQLGIFGASAPLFLTAVANADVMLMPQAVSVSAGATVTVQMVITNPGPETMAWTVRKSLEARLHSGAAQSEDVALTTTAAEGSAASRPADICKCRINSGYGPDYSGRSCWN